VTGTQLVRKLPTFYGVQKFITVLKEPAAGSYPESDESSQHPPILFL